MRIFSWIMKVNTCFGLFFKLIFVCHVPINIILQFLRFFPAQWHISHQYKNRVTSFIARCCNCYAKHDKHFFTKIVYWLTFTSFDETLELYFCFSVLLTTPQTQIKLPWTSLCISHSTISNNYLGKIKLSPTEIIFVRK